MKFAKISTRFLIWLVGTWAIAAIALCGFWPIQPRLTLESSNAFEVVGITPDSEEVIGITRRATRVVTRRGERVHWDCVSGPIQIWNLRTGQQRTIPIPGQSATGDRVETLQGTRVMLEPDSWEARRFQHSFRGNWFQFRMYQTDHPYDVQTVILNLDRDEVRILKSESAAEISLSPSGRWYLESTITDSGRSFEVRIFDTETGATPFVIDGKVWDRPCCFSSDDFYFGCSVGDVQATTRIWNVEAGTIALTIPHRVRGIGFSQSHRLMAGWVELRDSHDEPQKVEMRVWEVESGKIIHRWAPPNREDAPDYWRSGTFQFVENDAWLLYQNLSNVREGEDAVHASLDLKLAWNIETGQRVTDYRRGTVDPNISQNGIPPASLPSAFLSFNSNMEAENLCEIASGRQFFAIPTESNTILLTRDARTLVLHEYTEYHNRFLNLLLKLDSFGIPVPDFLWSVAPRNSDYWKVVEIPSGRTMATIPKQYEVCWLSPDEETLVTASNETDGVINVWDFPPRKQTRKPLAWSLLVPMVILGARWKWWRRPRQPAAPVGPQNQER